MFPCFAFMRRAVMFFALFILVSVVSLAQQTQPGVTLVIDGVPAETPVTDTLYLAGSFNDWNPKDDRYIFKREQDGKYVLTITRTLLPFPYKITRGSWETVEGDIQGKKIADRQLTKDESETHRIQIISWEDLAQLKSWNIVVTDLPENTPYQADIFVSGSFNDWKDHDVHYKLTPLNDGTYGIKIPKTANDTLWFKFHRGSWQSVECRANGRTIENRKVSWNKAQLTTTYTASITAWEDLAGGTNRVFSFWLACAVINAFVLILVLPVLPGNNLGLRSWTIAVTVVISLSLIARIASYSPMVFDWWPKLLVMADFSYFVVGPLIFLFVVRLVQVELPMRSWVVFIPAAIQTLLYAPILFLPTGQFVNDNLNYQFDKLFGYTSAVACFYNVGIWGYGMYLIKKQNAHITANSIAFQYGKRLLIVTGLILLIWLFSLGAMGIGELFSFDFRLVHEYAVDMIWIALSLVVYVNMVHAIRYPTLFHPVTEGGVSEEERRTSPHTKEDLETLKQQLEQVMKKRKPYLNAGLGLQDLADTISVNMHTVSWVINEGYKKNFFDFINEYRIEEFKRLVNHDQYKHFTFLALALEVGFSSKTTFNRAFKKFTGKTPREYFGTEQEAQLEGIN